MLYANVSICLALCLSHSFRSMIFLSNYCKWEDNVRQIKHFTTNRNTCVYRLCTVIRQITNPLQVQNVQIATMLANKWTNKKKRAYCEKHMIGLASTARSTTCFPSDTEQVITSSCDIWLQWSSGFDVLYAFPPFKFCGFSKRNFSPVLSVYGFWW